MRKIYFSILLMILISCYCCKKNTPNQLIKDSTNIEDVKKYLDLYYPDTVYINNIYEGKLLYKCLLDTITTTFFEEGDTMRLLTLYLQDNKTLIPNNYDHILNDKRCDTFYPLQIDGEITFEHKFNRLGVNYLEGVLIDEVIFKETDTSTGLRIITHYNHINLPVLVTDDENLIDSFYKDEPKNGKSEKNPIKQSRI